MGAVFEAETVATGDVVAIKVLYGQLAADPDLHRRFRREGSVLQALDHPAVVRVLDIGTDEADRAYTVMELLRGETLHARMRRPPRLTARELVPIVADTCAALSAVHEHGVIHGDVKPANLFLVEDVAEQGSSVKLVDFGSSKVHGLERLTRTGEVIGTPLYMAPELLTGEGDIDESIDTYALGVMLYEALAGRRPFRERNPGKLLFQIAMGRCAPLVDEAPDTPPPIAAVVHRAMATRRKDRFESARDLAEAYRAAVGGA
jgi:serine/threonine-protein kinase